MKLPVAPYGVTNLSGLIEWLRTLATSIAVGWGQEHNSDGTHGTVHASGGIFERGRSVAMGEWISVPFNAANFTSTGVGTAWGVDSGDVTTYAYTLIGNTMVVMFDIAGTDVTGTPVSIDIAIPGGYAAVKTTRNQIRSTDAGTAGTGQAVVTAGGAVIACFESTVTAWTATSSDNTRVAGQIQFEVQ